MPPASFKISRLVWLILGALVIALLLYQLRNALLPFIVGGCAWHTSSTLFISWLERRIPWMSSRPELKRVHPDRC